MPLHGIDQYETPTQHFVLGYVELGRWPKIAGEVSLSIGPYDFPFQHFVLGYVELGRWLKNRDEM